MFCLYADVKEQQQTEKKERKKKALQPKQAEDVIQHDTRWSQME